MGLGCVLFLWAILATIALAVAATGVAIFVPAARRRSMPGMVSGGLLGAAGAAVAIGAFVFIAGWLFRGMGPHETTSRAAFEDAFGFPAGAEVTQICSRTSGSTDSHEQFLHFHAPPPAITTIVRTLPALDRRRLPAGGAIVERRRAGVVDAVRGAAGGVLHRRSVRRAVGVERSMAALQPFDG